MTTPRWSWVRDQDGWWYVDSATGRETGPYADDERADIGDDTPTPKETT
jgi:hypothetical protein